MEERPRAVRPSHIEPDPRTDGIGDGGERELDPPTEDEIAAGLEHDQQHQREALRQLGQLDQ